MQNSYTSEAARRQQKSTYSKQYIEKIGREEYNRKYNAYQQQPERVAYKQQWEAQHKDRRKEYFRTLYHSGPSARGVWPSVSVPTAVPSAATGITAVTCCPFVG